jgi:death-on-curing protein
VNEHEPRWLDVGLVLDFHSEQLALFGGPEGVRDLGLLESALARPINKFAYGETDLAALAAAYGFGIAKNHPFVDGNKRTALASMIVFLGLNRIDLDAPQESATAIVLSMAAGEIGEDVLARWIAGHNKALIAPGIVP